MFTFIIFTISIVAAFAGGAVLESFTGFMTKIKSKFQK